jgi:tetratricopeptide (TPR) repeat protein
MEAYNLYLLARQQNQANPNGLAKAIEYFERAIERDPRFARAYGGLAVALDGMVPDYYGVRPRDAYGKANALASRALELDPDVAEAHLILGKFDEWICFDWKTAGARFERRLHSTQATHGDTSSTASICLQSADWLTQLRRASGALSSTLPRRAVRDKSMWFSYWARRYDDALADNNCRGIAAARGRLISSGRMEQY